MYGDWFHRRTSADELEDPVPGGGGRLFGIQPGGIGDWPCEKCESAEGGTNACAGEGSIWGFAEVVEATLLVGKIGSGRECVA